MENKKPLSPLNMIIVEGCLDFCPKCGSSAFREYKLFGKLRCIHPSCHWKEER